MLTYLSSDKGCFLYEWVTGFNSLASIPENGDFWTIKMCYSRLQSKGISQKEWEGCHKLFKLLKMRNLNDFNQIYNIQDIFILGVITEYRWQKIKEDMGFDPRCFTSACTLCCTIENVKSKIVITYPKDIKTVELIERLFSGGYSSVHMTVGFDFEMFTPKSKEYLAQKDKIFDDLRNIDDEPDEKSQRKVLMQNLIDLWKNEDRNNPHKVKFNLHLNGEE